MAKQFMVHIQLVAVCNDEATLGRIEDAAKRLGAYAHEQRTHGGMQITNGERELTDDAATELKALADAMKPLVVDEQTAYDASVYLAEVASKMGVTIKAMAVKLNAPTGGKSSL